MRADVARRVQPSWSRASRMKSGSRRRRRRPDAICTTRSFGRWPPSSRACRDWSSSLTRPSRTPRSRRCITREKRHFLVEDISVRMAPSAAAFAASASTAARQGDLTATVDFRRLGSARPTSIASRLPLEQRVDWASGHAPNGSLLTPRAGASCTSRPRLEQPELSVAVTPARRRRRRARDHPVRSLGSDIAQHTLLHTGLIVIDEAGAAISHRGEGTLSLARAFMAAGVPAVLGTLPGADESATRDLMIGFHREMAQEPSPQSRPSHTVQRNAIQQNGRRLGAWTALVIYGSDR